MNELFGEIKKVFEDAGIPDFSKNPADLILCGRFASLFKDLSKYLEAAKIQGFCWEKQEYEFPNKPKKTFVTMAFDKMIYDILLQRYKELSASGGGGGGNTDVPFEIDGYLTEIDTEKIDADYMNSRFEKYLKLMNLDPKPSEELVRQALDDLHKTFATLTQEEQKYANIFLHDIERGEVTIEAGKTLRDYITGYHAKEMDEQIHHMVDIFGINETKLREMMHLKLTEANINEYGRFDSLKNTVDKEKARAYFEEEQGGSISPPKVNILIDKRLRLFLIGEGS